MQLAAWTGGSWHNGVPRTVEGISADSRRTARGNIFIAIRGPSFDGHDFVISALQQGASAAVVARSDLINTASGPLLVVNDTSQALRRMAAGYRQTLNIKMIAVTGSVGKTTVKEMIAATLSRRFATAKTIGNWNNEYGLPLSVLNIDPNAGTGVFELGVNHPGELAPLCQLLKPDWGIITTIGPVHLEYFGSEKALADEKSVLLNSLPDEGIAFLGRDHPWFAMFNSTAGCRVISAGEDKDADYVLLQNGNRAGENEVFEKKSGEIFRFCLPLPGRHVAIDALFAIAVAREYEFDWASIREGLAAYQAPPMRWQAETEGEVLVINDAYNANPMSMAAALRAFVALQHAGRKWLVLAGMHELGAISEQEHEKLGMAVARSNLSGLVVVGLLGNKIAAGAEKAGMKNENIFRCDDHSAAARVLSGLLKPGDAVLFKASRSERLEKIVELWREIREN